MGVQSKRSLEQAGKRVKSLYPKNTASIINKKQVGPTQISDSDNPGTWTQKTLTSKHSTTKRI